MLSDRLITIFDHGLRTIFATAQASRVRPDANQEEVNLNAAEKAQAAALMRVNHVGEVCAQALYSGQALTSRNQEIINALQHAANEETDHLAWCEQRINELGGKKSILNPIWYAGSFTIGALAGAIGDKWNLGFLAETEKQVSNHLSGHLNKLSDKDIKTRLIVEQMYADEILHAEKACSLGAKPLPAVVKTGMQCISKLMTSAAYHV